MELRVHLKICEACGCLWYRSQWETGVYCTACSQRFKEFPSPESRKSRGRPKKLILPTVFAVQASAEVISRERSGYTHRYGIQPISNPGTHNAASAPTEIPFALLASGAVLSDPVSSGPVSSVAASSVSALSGGDR